MALLGQVRVYTLIVLFVMIGLGAILWGTDAVVAGLSAILKGRGERPTRISLRVLIL